MLELYDSKQKGVWEQITLKMIEIIEKHSLAYTNVNTYQKNKSLATVSTTFQLVAADGVTQTQEPAHKLNRR